jgi:DNA-binding CsgD family transcriptional regulator
VRNPTARPLSRQSQQVGIRSWRRIFGGVGAGQQQARCRERLERLATSTLDCESIQHEAITGLQRLVGFDRWCWSLADPETLLPLGGVAEHDYGPRVPRALELEYSGGDFAAKDVLARRANLAGSLSTETGGDLARSPRWDEVLRAVSIGDIAVVACRDALGCWGWIEAYRDSGDRPFHDDDLELLASIGPALGSALRRGLGFTPPPDRDAPTPSTTGVIVLNADLGVIDATAGARAWIDAFPQAGLFAAWGMLPATIYPTATRARAGRAVTGAHALERVTDGRWVMVEAAPLEERGHGHIVVTLRDATPRETFSRRCRVYGLSPREREVVAALVTGLDTRAVTERLFISRHTVQDHLKSVFEKMSIHSRREMLAMFNASQEE